MFRRPSAVPVPGVGACEEAIDPKLLRRLQRPAVRGGAVARGQAEAILARAQRMTGRAPLARLARRSEAWAEGQAAAAPIVYGQGAIPGVEATEATGGERQGAGAQADAVRLATPRVTPRPAAGDMVIQRFREASPGASGQPQQPGPVGQVGRQAQGPAAESRPQPPPIVFPLPPTAEGTPRVPKGSAPQGPGIPGAGIMQELPPAMPLPPVMPPVTPLTVRPAYTLARDRQENAVLVVRALAPDVAPHGAPWTAAGGSERGLPRVREIDPRAGTLRPGIFGWQVQPATAPLTEIRTAAAAAFAAAGATGSQAASPAEQRPVGARTGTALPPAPAAAPAPASPTIPAGTPGAAHAAGQAAGQAQGRDARTQAPQTLGPQEIDRIVEKVERRFLQRLATEGERRGKIR